MVCLDFWDRDACLYGFDRVGSWWRMMSELIKEIKAESEIDDFQLEFTE